MCDANPMLKIKWIYFVVKPDLSCLYSIQVDPRPLNASSRLQVYRLYTLWKVWFSNRRAKWRREEKLRSQRRDVDAGNTLDVAGFGVPSRFNITAPGAPGFNVSSCNMYPGPAAFVHQPLVSVAAVTADPYRYHELAFIVA